MKATIDFNLPEDRADFEYAINGHRWASVLWELDNELRAHIKHSDRWTPEQKEAMQKVRDTINELMIENTITFD
jgi:hypothetical protein